MTPDPDDPRPSDGREDAEPEDKRGTIPPAEEPPEQIEEESPGDESQQPLGDPGSDEESLRYKQLERDREHGGAQGEED